MKLRYFILTAMLFFSLALTGCEKDGPAERLGEDIDNAVEKTGEAIQDAGDKVEDAVK